MHRNGGGAESPASYVKVLAGGSPIWGRTIYAGEGNSVWSDAGAAVTGGSPDFPENRENNREFSIFRLVRQGWPARVRARLQPGPGRVRTSSGPANAASS
jgi:hypothetical protein